jgi:hypothetical protein
MRTPVSSEVDETDAITAYQRGEFRPVDDQERAKEEAVMAAHAYLRKNAPNGNHCRRRIHLGDTMSKAERGVRAFYDPVEEQIVVALANRASFRVPVERLAAVAKVDAAMRAAVTVSRDGDGLRWDALDVDYYWPYLMGVLFGPAAWKRAAYKVVSGIKSPAKARASRENGRKGGRPRKRPIAAR